MLLSEQLVRFLQFWNLVVVILNYFMLGKHRAVARALLGGGGEGVYSYIRVLCDEFLLKSVVFKFISKENSRAEYE